MFPGIGGLTYGGGPGPMPTGKVRPPIRQFDIANLTVAASRGPATRLQMPSSAPTAASPVVKWQPSFTAPLASRPDAHA